jgi:hypothetical protein
MLQYHATFGIPELVHYRYFSIGGRVARCGSLIRYLRLADPFSVSSAVSLTLHTHFVLPVLNKLGKDASLLNRCVFSRSMQLICGLWLKRSNRGHI